MPLKQIANNEHAHKKTALADGLFMGRIIRLAPPHLHPSAAADRRTPVRLGFAVKLTSVSSRLCIRRFHKKTALADGFFMGRIMRLELTTSGTTNQRSNQLS